MDVEDWRVIDGYDGIYWISSLGNVCSLKGKHPKLLKPGSSAGYPFVNLLKDGAQISIKIHRLVAEAFLESPLINQVVNHKDGNKQNNRVQNLEWVSYSENNRHAMQTGLRDHIKPVIAIPVRGNVGFYFPSQAHAAEAGFHQGHISAVCLGKLKTHAGFAWHFANADLGKEISMYRSKA
ncbi:NUMOD4 motif-containing HNH endonuclease [Metapseudomonas furukawaii]|uniref:NUMOD4 motif-containing HNH endonuclease n=1 Tax=Metapseudomonas furukawaii TaxID=1149133 RepID=UPI00227BF8F9|nr:NUMOD4 motif-containing HNH endonuclease [Pseudomonas furukawaii]WAG77023.1 NUMOD4 motif-containing HNH endonuclease [Pseudomonas furukawaii]